MIPNEKSTINYSSNLYPVQTEFCGGDKNFLSKIIDPLALEELTKSYNKRYYDLLPEQERQFKASSLLCSGIHEKDPKTGYVSKRVFDYVHGTIIKDGKPHDVCRCTKTNCVSFQKCRPDFKEEELKPKQDNWRHEKEINEIVSLTFSKKDGDAKAAAEVFAGAFLKNPPSNASVLTNVVTAIKRAANIFKNHPSDNNHEIEDDPDKPKIEDPQETRKENDRRKRFTRPTESNSITGEYPKSLPLPPPNPPKKLDFSKFDEVTQEKIIQRLPTEYTLVNAGPGTGKTWTLIEKIKYMLTEQGVLSKQILVLCFSRSAIEEIKKRLENEISKSEIKANLNQLDVRTFDSFCTYLLYSVKKNSPQLIKDIDIEPLSYDQRIVWAERALKDMDQPLPDIRHIFVDEVQDLVGKRAELVLTLLRVAPKGCGFTLFGDSCQALYDYQAIRDKSILTSTDFYDRLSKRESSLTFYKLGENFRQNPEFENLTIPYRTAILSGDPKKMVAKAKNLLANIQQAEINFKELDEELLYPYMDIGSLGILARTNGQALQISTWLHDNEIPHTLQKTLVSTDFSDWIAKVFLDFNESHVDRESFSEQFRKVYKVARPDAYWEALLSAQENRRKESYRVSELLEGLLRNKRNPLLSKEVVEEEKLITVSTVHRAKGREFDSVLVFDDVLDGASEYYRDDSEHKVFYVALTRPKKQIEKVFLGKQKILYYEVSRRTFKVKEEGKRLSGATPRYLTHYEIGREGDFDLQSFALDSHVQQYILQMQPQTRLKLIKCLEKTKPYVVYRLVPEEDESITLAYTSEAFSQEMKQVMLQGFGKGIYGYNYFQQVYKDIYLEGLTTCMSHHEVKGAKKIDDLYLWLGLSVSGFAQMERIDY